VCSETKERTRKTEKKLDGNVSTCLRIETTSFPLLPEVISSLKFPLPVMKNK
jgi:hypothetical protein